MLHCVRQLLKTGTTSEDVRHQRQVHNKGPSKNDAELVMALMFPTKTTPRLEPVQRTKSEEPHVTSGREVLRCSHCPLTATLSLPGSFKYGHGSLDSLLRDKGQMRLFKDFLKMEYSVENMEFYMACEKFKQIKARRKMATKAQKIYKKYIVNGSPKQVNLDAVMCSDIADLLSHPRPDMFNRAQKRIQNILENDSYRRFLELNKAVRTRSSAN